MIRNRLLAIAIAASAAGGASSCFGAPKALAILGNAAVPSKDTNGEAIDELSGLAWDSDQQLLYAVSDDGALHHFRIRTGMENVVELKSVFSAPLSIAVEAAGGKDLINAEGLAVKNGNNGDPSDSELLVAFEDGPMIARFTPRGEYLGSVALPHPLNDPQSYSENNSRLEAVAFDLRYGILTGPEEALIGTPDERHTIFDMGGRTWPFTTFQPHRSNLKAIEVLPDGGFFILERTRKEAGGESVARLRYFHPDGCRQDALCAVSELAEIPLAELSDNFEGMARISDTDFVVVTDRKKKDSVKTKMVIFRMIR